MKGFICSVLAFVLIAGGLSVSYSKTEDTQSVSIGMNDPEKAAKAAGSIITEIGESLQTLTDQDGNVSGPFGAAGETLYRIRKPDYDPTSQIGAYSSFDNAKSMCIQGYCIFDQNGTLIYSNPPAP